MRIEDYLELCTGQMRCKAMRPSVDKELRCHMEEQKEAYLADGMTEEEAEEKAVRDMGDPVETGAGLDRVHRPKMDWKTVGFVLVLAAIGVGVQAFLQPDGLSQGAGALYLKSAVAGIAVMLTACFLDYTFLGKHPIFSWWSVVLLTAVTGMLTARVNGAVRNSWAYMLLVPAFAGIVFYYRPQGKKGILKALAHQIGGWLILQFMPGAIALPPNGAIPVSFLSHLWMIGCFIMLGYAVCMGWYGVKRRYGAAVFSLPFVGGLLAILKIFSAGQSYQTERIKAMLNPKAYMNANGFMQPQILQMMDGLRWIGNADHVITEDTENYTLILLAGKFGIIAAAVLLLLLCLLTVFLIYRISRQANRLGMITGIGIVWVLMVPIVIHSLMNAGKLFPISCALPFISMSGRQNISMYFLMGILLSVFRTTNTRPEPETGQKMKYADYFRHA